MTMLDGVGWRSYPSWEVFGQQTPLGCTLAVPVSRHDNWLGSRGAPVTVVFYGDYTSVASRGVYADLKQIESLAGRRLALVYRHLIDESDEVAVRFAETAEAAGAQGLFWAAHDRFYRHLRTASNDIDTAASEIGLDPRRLHHDLVHRCFLPTVLAHRDGARASDVHSAPRLFINEVAVPAAVEVRELWTLVQEELCRAEGTWRRPKSARAKPTAGENSAPAAAHDYGPWVARRRTRQSPQSATAASG